MPTLDAGQIDLIVLTHREGVLSPVGHDLKLRATSLRAVVPDDASSVELTIDARRIEVACAMRGEEDAPGALSASDKRDIEGRMTKEVLAVARHPEIRFRSSAIERVGDSATVRGQLTIVGATRPITLALAHDAAGGWSGEVRLRQTDFGIAPYRAMLGALKVKDELVVRVAVRAGALPART